MHKNNLRVYCSLLPFQRVSNFSQLSFIKKVDSKHLSNTNRKMDCLSLTVYSGQIQAVIKQVHNDTVCFEACKWAYGLETKHMFTHVVIVKQVRQMFSL